MKCPRCGLVHAAAEQVCRRCELDLRTGEPHPRATAAAAVVESANPLDKLRGLVPARLGKKPAPAAPATKPAAEPGPKKPAPGRTAEHAEAHARSEAARKSASFFRAQKDKVRLPAFLRRKAKTECPPMTCVQCTEPMHVVHDNLYPFWQPLLLWLLGAALLLTGIRFHLLLITGVLAVVAGVFFHRVGGSHWRCSSCGMIVPRAR